MQPATSDFSLTVNQQVTKRREQYAQVLTNLIKWVILFISLSEVVAWLFLRDYVQILVHAATIGILGVTAFCYEPLRRRGHSTLGIYLLLVSALLLLEFVPFLLPASLPAMAVGYLLVMALGNILLGDRPSRWLIGASVLMFGISFAASSSWTPPFFPPLDPKINLGAGLFIGLSTLACGGWIVRVIVVGQDDQFRQTRMGALEIQQRVMLEQEQNERLQQVNEEIKRRAAIEQEQRQTLQHLINQIREVAETLNGAASEILAATTQQVSNSSEQDAAVMQTVDIVEEVRATVTQAAERAQVVADAARQSAEISRAGQQSVADTIDGMKLIRERVESIAETILSLSERTQQIGEIIATVNDLADQSKLLALNASIEAARAGEDGKGFAVVAMEVRQLAEQSRNATARVRDILHEIQQATNTAVMVTEEGSKGADNGLLLVQRAGEAIDQLAMNIEEATQAATQIAALANQQTNGMEQLAAVMGGIRQTTVQSTSSTRQTEQSARHLSEIARQMEQTVARYRE